MPLQPWDKQGCESEGQWVPSEKSTSVACEAVACLMVACWPWEYGTWDTKRDDTAPICGG